MYTLNKISLKCQITAVVIFHDRLVLPTMSAFKDFCKDEPTFNLYFAIVISSLSMCIIIAIIVFGVLCIERRRRKHGYKRKYQKSVAREEKALEEWNRILTYLAYMKKLGYLKLPEKCKPKNTVQLLDDAHLTEDKKTAAMEVVLFFSPQSALKKDSISITSSSSSPSKF